MLFISLFSIDFPKTLRPLEVREALEEVCVCVGGVMAAIFYG